MKRNLSKLLPLFVMAMFSFAKSAQASEIYHSVQNGASEGEVIAYAGGYTKVSSLSFLDIYLGDGAANWTAKNILLEGSFVGQDGVSYSTAFVQGGTNGMIGHLIHKNGMSAHVKLVPSGDGTVYIAAKYGATKPIWAAKVPNNSVSSLNMADMTPYLIPGFSEAIATDSGIVMTKAMYINDAGTGLQESTASADTYATLPLQVEAGYTYYFWASGSKIMLCGINANEITAPKPTSYPTSTDLARYYTPGQLCVAIYFREQVCNDVIFVGTYNNWSTTPNQCAKFQPVVGFDGWYVVAVTDNSSNIEGKPVQLANDGSFSWIYQTGDADSWTLVSGYVSISAGDSGESNLTNYDTSTPVILISDYFKNHNSPCGDVRHTYTVNLKAPVCGNFTPAIIGDFNQWATGIAMTYDAATGTYSHSFTGNEGESFKFLACGYDDWSNELLIYQDGSWIPNPDITLTDQLTYTLDYSEGKYALCEEETYNFTYDIVNSEAILTGYNGTLPESVEIPATITIGNTLYDVTSIGDGAFYDCSSLISIILPNSVTSIGDYAFDNCSSLTSITLPNSVTSIGHGAFEDCSSLTSVTIPNSLKSIGINAFKNCSSLTSITIPNSVTSIGGDAFYGCTSLPVEDNLRYVDTYLVEAVDKSLSTYTIKEGTKWIGSRAFSYCSSLTSITIPDSVISIGEYAFASCSSLTSITIPNSVTTIGGDAFSSCSSLTSIILPNSVTSIGDWAFNGCSSLTSITLPNSVTSIGECAFYHCSSLTSITIPNSVTSIGDHAFAGCSSITSITLPNSVTSIGENAFSSCSSLTSITLPNSVTSIGNGAFSSCSSLTSITIPNSVTSIENYAFYDCSSLTSITIPNSVTSIGSWAFWICSSLTSITIPNSVTSIGSSAFEDCSTLTSITLPNSVTSIGNYAFKGCSSLTSITIPYSVTSIGYEAFRGCSALTSITLPNSVTSIGSRAFSYCSSLTSLTIPNSVTSIGIYAFERCSALTSITIPNSVTFIGESAFMGCSSLTFITLPNSVTSIGNGTFSGCSSLTSIILPNSVTSIGRSAFSGCSTLTSISIGNSVTSIESSAFRSCSSLTSITIPNSVTFIRESAFEDCSSLTSITLPNSVISIGGSAFYGCSSLTSVTSLSCTPPSCGSNVFAYTQQEKTLVVPSNSLASYKSAYAWKDFTSFEKCLSVFVQSSDSTLGVAQIDQDVDCDSVAIISAVGNLGFAFTKWSDGNTDNPRTIKLTQDTTLTAEFGLAYSGKCGDELYWTYSNQEIKIIGTGAMYNYTDSTMPWTLLRDSIKTVRVGNNATSIGEYAFANTLKLAELHIGTNVENIGANAFAGCTRLYDIYCYPTYPPFAESNSFANYNVYVYVPCENLRDYTLNVVWGKFKFIECIGSEDVEVSGNEVTVSPSYEDATFTWPVTDGADTYSLVITKGGVTFCTLVFNAQGQLVSIAFKPRRQNAPAAEGTTPATYAEMTANGFRFTVTGLDEGAEYAYTLTVRNATNTVLETYTGDFTTLSNTPTGINESAGEDAHAAGQVEKIIRDGRVLILRNGVAYDMMGNTL